MKVRLYKQLRSFALDVDLDIGSEDILGIMGHSGSGKSMLLKCIAGLERADEGYVEVNGAIWQDPSLFLPPQKRQVGFCFQNYALFDTFSVEKNIRLGLSGKYRPKLDREQQQRRIREMISLFSLEGLEHAYPLNLSGGQRQRTALARMLASDPQVCLLDEPFSAIDTDLKQSLYESLRPVLLSLKRPVLLVSHDRHEIETLCTRMVKIEEGKIVEEMKL